MDCFDEKLIKRELDSIKDALHSVDNLGDAQVYELFGSFDKFDEDIKSSSMTERFACRYIFFFKI